MKKLVLVALAMLFIAVPLFAASQGDDTITLSLTIAAGTTITPSLTDTVVLTTSAGTGNSVSAGTITLASNTNATWYFVLQSQNTGATKGKLVSGTGATFDYTVSLGSILEESPVSLATDKQGTITATAGTSTIATLKIHYGATNLLTAGTYTDTVKVFFYDSDPSL